MQVWPHRRHQASARHPAARRHRSDTSPLQPGATRGLRRLPTLLAAWIGLASPLNSPAQDLRSELVPTSLSENGSTVHLELVWSRPPLEGPLPTAVIHHGSTGSGTDPALFRLTWTSSNLARFFNDRGWQVVFPQRRGRGRSEGTYAEGLAQGGGYSCSPPTALAGLERALEDADAILAHLRTRAEVDPRRLLSVGFSRGGLLAIVHAGTRPGSALGAINFVGGWMSDQCPDPVTINTASFRRGGTFPGPTLWLYGANDPFYSLAHSRSNHAAFLTAGGSGAFLVSTLPPGISGHNLLAYPDRWETDLGAFLATIPVNPPPVTPLPGPPARLQVDAGAPITSVQWFRNGLPIPGAVAPVLHLDDASLASAGIYHASVNVSGLTLTTDPLPVGFDGSSKVTGDGIEVGTDILHPNGRIYDQVLLTGPAVAVQADPGQITRSSFLDLDGDIVQVEFSGPGTLAILLGDASGPTPPALYNQPRIGYWKGAATLVVSGATGSTYLSVFTVGRITAVNPKLFFDSVAYDGIADLAAIAIVPADTQFGALRAGNARLSASSGVAGVLAPGRSFLGPLFVGEITASSAAIPMLLAAEAPDFRVTGGSLHQPNSASVRVAGPQPLRFTAGTNSHGVDLPARTPAARFEAAGRDVTTAILASP